MTNTSSQKGFAMVTIMVIVAVLVVLGIGGAVYYNNQKTSQSPTPTPSVARGSTSTTLLSLQAQGGSGVSGNYQIFAVDGIDGVNSKVRVVLTLSQYATGVFMPANLHSGSCASTGGVKYSLSNVVNGRSETVLNTSLAKLKTDLPLAIKIQQSALTPEIVACSDVNVDGSIDVLLNGLR